MISHARNRVIFKINFLSYFLAHLIEKCVSNISSAILSVRVHVHTCALTPPKLLGVQTFDLTRFDHHLGVSVIRCS